MLEKFAEYPRRLGDLKGEYLSLEMWHETNQQDDGTIRRETCFPVSPDEWVLSGPHFFVGTPLYKTPRAVCTEKGHYDPIDLTIIPDDYLPRTNYVPACSPDEYRSRIPRVPWVEEGESEGQRVTDFYRFVNRRMISISGERSLICSLIPPGTSHVNTVIGTTFKNERVAVGLYGLCTSLVADFFLKSSAKADLYESTLKLFPLFDSDELIARSLSLACLSSHYAALWNRFQPTLSPRDGWSQLGFGINSAGPLGEGATWSPASAVRMDYHRRLVMLEIDVLAAREINLDLEELLAIYRVQFPVMRQYEAETFYDQTGRIIFTPSKGLSSVGLPRKARPSDLKSSIHYGIQSDKRTESNIALGWEDVRDMQSGTVTKTFMDDTLPDGPHERTIEYIAPFFRPDREEDYRVAWEFFETRTANKDES